MRFKPFITFLIFIMIPTGAYSKYDQQLLNQVRLQTKSLCHEVDYLTENTVLGMGMPTIPARFFTESFLKTYSSLDFSNTEEVEIFLHRYRNTFKQTLKKCWPNNPSFQKSVLVMIELSIWEGRFVGVLSHVGMLKGATWSFKKLIKYSKWIAGGAVSSLAIFFGYSRFELVDDDIEQIEDDFEIIESEIDEEELLSHGIDLGLVSNSKNRICMLEEQLKTCDSECERLRDAIEILKRESLL